MNKNERGKIILRNSSKENNIFDPFSIDETRKMKVKPSV